MWILRNFYELLFYRAPPGDCFSKFEDDSYSQSILHIFLLCLKRNDSNTFKISNRKKTLFSSVYNIVTTCFDKSFFIWCDNWHRYPEVLCNRHVLALFEARHSKEVRTLFFISKSFVLIPKWKVPKWSSGMSYLLHFTLSCFFTKKMFQNLKISRVAGFF